MQKDNVRIQAETKIKYKSWFKNQNRLNTREQYYLRRYCQIFDNSLYLRGGGTILEVGFGDGKMLRELSNIYKDAKFIGVEAREKCVADMKTLGYDCRFVSTEIFDMGEEFDIIYGNAVLHHMSNPYLTLESLLKLLKPKGILVFTGESHPFCIPDIIYVSIKNEWSVEKNLLKMNRLRFVEILSRYPGTFYVKYDGNPVIACFKKINSIYEKFYMNRIPFWNSMMIFFENE